MPIGAEQCVFWRRVGGLGREKLRGLLRGQWRQGGRYEEVGAAGDRGGGQAVQMADMEGAPLRGGGDGGGWDVEAQAPAQAGSQVRLCSLIYPCTTQLYLRKVMLDAPAVRATAPLFWYMRGILHLHTAFCRYRVEIPQNPSSLQASAAGRQ